MDWSLVSIMVLYSIGLLLIGALLGYRLAKSNEEEIIELTEDDEIIELTDLVKEEEPFVLADFTEEEIATLREEEEIIELTDLIEEVELIEVVEPEVVEAAKKQPIKVKFESIPSRRWGQEAQLKPEAPKYTRSWGIILNDSFVPEKYPYSKLGGPNYA